MVVLSVIASFVAHLYSTTGSRLEERNRQLERNVEAGKRTAKLHKQDFELAPEIQQQLMPKHLPQLRGFQFAATCQAARRVRGDYYDAIPVGVCSVAIVIGDVSGKGIAAALPISNLQAIVRTFALAGIAPHEFFAKANRLIAGSVAPGKIHHVLLRITGYDAHADGLLQRSPQSPILKRRDGAIEILGGPVLGVFAYASYFSGTAQLRSGDCLMLFTAGITEAMGAANEEVGEQRLIDSLDEQPTLPSSVAAIL